jgi:uncharacterized membrane protein YdbT with pleckstrin-like domain
METKKYKPKFDKLYWWIFVPTELLVLGVLIVGLVFEPTTLFCTVPTAAFVTYFLISPFFGYTELHEDSLFIKYGLILKREIPYKKIRKLECKRSFISESMMSLKCAFEHVEIRYNSFDVTTVSVKDEDEFIREIEARKAAALEKND